MDKIFTQCARCMIQRTSQDSGLLRRCISGSSVQYKKKQSHYDTLSIKTDASPGEIRQAFLKLSKTVHPDLNPDDPKNHVKFVQLNEAYSILSKPSTRREYDFTLAHRVYYDDMLKRHGYSSHTPGESYSPGAGTARDQGFEAQQRAFWDETIWYMRDKSRDKDAFYAEDSYYGIKGLRRVSNSHILFICVGVMASGTLFFFLCLKYSYKKSQQYADLQQRKNYEIYNRARANAMKYTNAEQLQNIFSTNLHTKSSSSDEEKKSQK